MGYRHLRYLFRQSETYRNMQVSSAKENILKKIRQALVHPTPVPFPQSEGNSSVYAEPSQDSDIEFAENFGKLQGRFLYCSNQEEMIVQLAQLISQQGWTQVFCREQTLLPMLREPLKGLLIDDDLPEVRETALLGDKRAAIFER